MTWITAISWTGVFLLLVVIRQDRKRFQKRLDSKNLCLEIQRKEGKRLAEVCGARDKTIGLLQQQLARLTPKRARDGRFARKTK